VSCPVSGETDMVFYILNLLAYVPSIPIYNLFDLFIVQVLIGSAYPKKIIIIFYF
jgi:hypothetical protein